MTVSFNNRFNFVQITKLQSLATVLTSKQALVLIGYFLGTPSANRIPVDAMLVSPNAMLLL